MRSLFLKIFIIFWIAESLIFVISTALILNRRFPGPAPFLGPAYNALRGESAHAIADYESQGCAGMLEHARERNATIALADTAGNILCKSAEFSGSKAIVPDAEIGGAQAGDDYIWTVRSQSATGQRLPLHAERGSHERAPHLVRRHVALCLSAIAGGDRGGRRGHLFPGADLHAAGGAAAPSGARAGARQVGHARKGVRGPARRARATSSPAWCTTSTTWRSGWRAW